MELETERLDVRGKRRPEPMFSLSQSQRGNLVVQIGSWRFSKHACWGSKVRWACIKKKIGCTASITTVDNVIVKTLGSHNHYS
ncbi:FLYWCH zinc finger domain-containing protein [Phthorimaea operculella]|nr:FLYWCH zinc finger domain-containing protein [Phthorimaea operculella]